VNFGEALATLKDGGTVSRSGWNGKGMWLGLQRPDEGSKMTLPYIFMKTVTGDLVPWLASQSDMLAEDWDVVQEPPKTAEPPKPERYPIRSEARYDINSGMPMLAVLWSDGEREIVRGWHEANQLAEKFQVVQAALRTAPLF
jgi:hypothetical protein